MTGKDLVVSQLMRLGYSQAEAEAIVVRNEIAASLVRQGFPLERALATANAIVGSVAGTPDGRDSLSTQADVAGLVAANNAANRADTSVVGQTAPKGDAQHDGPLGPPAETPSSTPARGGIAPSFGVHDDGGTQGVVATAPATPGMHHDGGSRGVIATTPTTAPDALPGLHTSTPQTHVSNAFDTINANPLGVKAGAHETAAKSDKGVVSNPALSEVMNAPPVGNLASLFNPNVPAEQPFSPEQLGFAPNISPTSPLGPQAAPFGLSGMLSALDAAVTSQAQAKAEAQALSNLGLDTLAAIPNVADTPLSPNPTTTTSVSRGGMAAANIGLDAAAGIPGLGTGVLGSLGSLGSLGPPGIGGPTGLAAASLAANRADTPDAPFGLGNLGGFPGLPGNPTGTPGNPSGFAVGNPATVGIGPTTGRGVGFGTNVSPDIGIPAEQGSLQGIMSAIAAMNAAQQAQAPFSINVSPNAPFGMEPGFTAPANPFAANVNANSPFAVAPTLGWDAVPVTPFDAPVTQIGPPFGPNELGVFDIGPTIAALGPTLSIGLLGEGILGTPSTHAAGMAAQRGGPTAAPPSGFDETGQPIAITVSMTPAPMAAPPGPKDAALTESLSQSAPMTPGHMALSNMNISPDQDVGLALSIGLSPSAKASATAEQGIAEALSALSGLPSNAPVTPGLNDQGLTPSPISGLGFDALDASGDLGGVLGGMGALGGLGGLGMGAPAIGAGLAAGLASGLATAPGDEGQGNQSNQGTFDASAPLGDVGLGLAATAIGDAMAADAAAALGGMGDVGGPGLGNPGIGVGGDATGMSSGLGAGIGVGDGGGFSVGDGGGFSIGSLGSSDSPDGGGIGGLGGENAGMSTGDGLGTGLGSESSDSGDGGSTGIGGPGGDNAGGSDSW